MRVVSFKNQRPIRSLSMVQDDCYSRERLVPSKWLTHTIPNQFLFLSSLTRLSTCKWVEYRIREWESRADSCQYDSNIKALFWIWITLWLSLLSIIELMIKITKGDQVSVLLNESSPWNTPKWNCGDLSIRWIHHHPTNPTRHGI